MNKKTHRYRLEVMQEIADFAGESMILPDMIRPKNVWFFSSFFIEKRSRICETINTAS